MPNVSLPSPGSTQPCPASEPCWSPTIAASGGAPGSAVAWPTTPNVSTIVGSSEGSRPSTSIAWRSQLPASASRSPVTPAFVASVTWSAPSESTCASQQSMVPKRSVPAATRSAGACWTSQRSLVADAFGGTRSPSPWSVRQSMTVRRSCQPIAGPTGSPVPASQTTVVARWFVIPTPATLPAPSSTARAVSSAASASARASTSTVPGADVVGSTGIWRVARTVPSGATRLERTELVPTSTTRSSSLTGRAAVRSPAPRG